MTEPTPKRMVQLLSLRQQNNKNTIYKNKTSNSLIFHKDQNRNNFYFIKSVSNENLAVTHFLLIVEEVLETIRKDDKPTHDFF